jgi:hypothetical protein
MYTEVFLNRLPEDPYEAIELMCEQFFDEHNKIPEKEEIDCFKLYIEAFAAVEAFKNANGLSFHMALPELRKPLNPEVDIKTIVAFFSTLKTYITARVQEITLSKSREKYTKMFGGAFLYQFTDGDINRIQQLINELRDAITKSELFDATHKQRILNKFEKLQAELHKEMTKIDGLWGLIGEAGVVLGKFGKDAKPFADRIREIAQITWRTQARAEELPSGATLPLLSDGEPEVD